MENTKVTALRTGKTDMAVIISLNTKTKSSVSGEKHRMVTEHLQEPRHEEGIDSYMSRSIMQAKDIDDRDNDTGLGMEINDTQDDNYNDSNRISEVYFTF